MIFLLILGDLRLFSFSNGPKGFPAGYNQSVYLSIAINQLHNLTDNGERSLIILTMIKQLGKSCNDQPPDWACLLHLWKLHETDRWKSAKIWSCSNYKKSGKINLRSCLKLCKRQQRFSFGSRGSDASIFTGKAVHDTKKDWRACQRVSHLMHFAQLRPFSSLEMCTRKHGFWNTCVLYVGSVSQRWRADMWRMMMCSCIKRFISL